MKHFFLFFGLFSFVSPAPKEEASGTLTLRFEGIEKAGGTVRLAMYDASSEFMVEEKAVLYNFKADKAGILEGKIENLAVGSHAFAVFLDENNNKQLDKNLFGVPTEPYGFSKVPPSKWRLPTWDEVRFEVGPTDHVLLIQLKRWALL
jgi:uncharacterized protein (DUF2141 family)